LCLVVAALYGRSVGYPFIGFDDTTLIVDNQAFLADPANLPRAFTRHSWSSPSSEGAGAYYRPLLVVSLMADAQWAGARPWAYHVTNLALHAAAAFVASLFFARLLAGTVLPWFLGLVVATHPVLVEVVAWVPGRNESLLALLVAASMIALDRYLLSGRRRWLGAHLGLSLLALFAKEHAVALGVIVSAFVGLIHRRRLTALPGLWIGWATILGAWLVARNAALAAPLPVALVDLLRHARAGVLVPVHYAGKTFVPAALSIMPTPIDTPLWPGLLGGAVVAASLVLARPEQRRVAIFGVVWFACFVAPTLVVPVLVGQEPRLYVPMLGLLVTAAAGLRRIEGWRREARWAGVAALLLLGSLTWSRVPDFSSRERFWHSAVLVSPHSSLALMNLASVRLDEGRAAEGEALSRRALAVNPRERKAENNLAVALAMQGREGEAELHFLRELRTNPGYADAWYNLGTLLARSGRTEEAARRWREAVARKPGHVPALTALSRYHLARGEDTLARPYQEALRRAGPTR
jgi:hypothetical protein